MTSNAKRICICLLEDLRRCKPQNKNIYRIEPDVCRSELCSESWRGGRFGMLCEGESVIYYFNHILDRSVKLKRSGRSHVALLGILT